MIQYALKTLAPLALVAFTGCSSSTENQLELNRELALRWYQMNELDRSEEQVVKALDIEPEDPQMLLLRAWIRQRRGTRDDILIAEQIFRDLDPSDYRVLLGLASSLERKGLLYFEAAEGAAQAETEERAGELRAKASDAWRESLQQYQETLQLSAGNARALSGLQRVYSQLADYDRSLEYAAQHREVVETELEFNQELLTDEISAIEERSLREAIRTNENALLANVMHAAPLYLRQGRVDKALIVLNRAIELDPKLAAAYSLRAQVLSELGRHRDALGSVDRFLELSTELDYDHPDIQRAYRLKSACEHELSLGAAEVEAS